MQISLDLATIDCRLSHIELRPRSITSQRGKSALIDVRNTGSGSIICHALSHTRDLPHLLLHLLFGQSIPEILIFFELSSKSLNDSVLLKDLLLLVSQYFFGLLQILFHLSLQFFEYKDTLLELIQIHHRLIIILGALLEECFEVYNRLCCLICQL